MTKNQVKNQSIETDPKMTEMIKLSEKVCKTAIMNILTLFKS